MPDLKWWLGIAVLGGVAACFGDATSSSSTAAGYAGGGSAGSSSGSGSSVPTLALVDANRSLNAAPGQGVGVFVTYQSGGKWLIQWTCDTSVTGESCNFQFLVTAATGTASGSSGAPIQDLLSSVAPGGDVTQDEVSQLMITTTTTAEEDQVSFDTTPGAAITVNVTMGGQSTGQYFFFVQDGAVNGGYQGPLADPLTFEPTSA